MKRTALTLGLTLLATPAAAQWLGEPAWNDPTAGTGFTIYGDYSRPNSNVAEAPRSAAASRSVPVSSR